MRAERRRRWKGRGRVKDGCEVVGGSSGGYSGGCVGWERKRKSEEWAAVGGVGCGGYKHLAQDVDDVELVLGEDAGEAVGDLDEIGGGRVVLRGEEGRGHTTVRRARGRHTTQT